MTALDMVRDMTCLLKKDINSIAESLPIREFLDLAYQKAVKIHEMRVI